ncbi:uncharacterized protein LOC109845935 [Asparagus officinalis]|uniref:uncharacterized protein LOC109845935 n=1 Tax=Asparagus officinalis TaxID=4686 RepID=UPI00098E094E|nr:uncharacterized protein LOC109845935 [Asparagus officinalis]
MHEELGALEKNRTWELVKLPEEKRAVGCKWVFTVKQNPDGQVERYKARLVAKGYSQTYGIDYDETFAPVAKMSIVWTLISLAVNGDDEKEIAQLKERLDKEFEVKDLGLLRYFLGIEISRGAEGIILSQRKYALDLLKETGMLGCKLATTPIDQKFKLGAEAGEPVDRDRYQRLVGRLIYLSHTRPDISFAMSVVSHYMHDPRKGHMDAVYQILRYLKSAPGKELILRKNKHMSIEGYCDSDWASCADDRRSTSGYCIFIGGNLVSWKSKK